MKTPKVLYFSLNHSSVDLFYQYNEKTRAQEILSFRLFPKDGPDGVGSFSHASDIIFFLEKQEKNGSLPEFVIIDYLSLTSLKSDNPADSIERSRSIILRAILKYPEIHYLFDETRKSIQNSTINNSFNFLSFLFFGDDENKEDVFKEYHTFKASCKLAETYDSLVRGRDNLFDGSRLRFACCRSLHSSLKVNRHNFGLSQESRKNHLALCIEEEHSQNRFNSYALFANGFRVIPIVTAKELKYFNSEYGGPYTKPSMILRDYDLQFPDANEPDDDIMVKHQVSTNPDYYSINEVDYIRGAKFWNKTSNKHKPVEYPQPDSTLPVDYTYSWYNTAYHLNLEIKRLKEELKEELKNKDSNDPMIKNLKKQIEDKEKYIFWDKLQNKVSIYFVSKGVDKVDICSSEVEYQKKLRKRLLDNQQHSVFFDNSEYQVLKGIYKPVSGIYLPFQLFPDVATCYSSFEITDIKTHINREIELFKDKYNDDDLKKYIRIKYYTQDHTDDDELPEDIKRAQGWYIDTSRVNHDHGVPLDVYDLVKSMLDRARNYYSIGKYIRSAIISTGAMEILNGFHEALMLQAYHLLSISENAIAMNAIGGNEDILRDDAFFRIEKIRNELNRIMDRKEDDSRATYKDNVLNQIFSDCRNFCKEREHFEAEEAFISAMGHLNEGFSLSQIKESFRGLNRSIEERFDAELLFMVDTLSETIKKEEASLYLGNYIYNNNDPRQLHLLNKNKRKYKRLSGKEWVMTADDSSKASLLVNTKTRIGIKRKKKSLFKKIIWESSNSEIATFEGDVVCAHKPGSVTLSAKIGKEVLTTDIEIKDNAQITNTE